MASLPSNRFIILTAGALASLAACASDQKEPEQPQAAYPAAGQQYPQQQYPQQQQYPAQQYPQQQAPTAQQPYPAVQQPAPAQPYPAQPYPAQPAPAGQPAPTAPPAAAPPGVLAAPAAAGAQATPIDPAAAGAIQPLLVQLAGTTAPSGAKPIGSLMTANFQTGQQLEAQVQMEPGRCYTVVAAGMPPGVTDIDIQLVAVTPMAGMAPVLAVDNTTGAQAILGEKPNCYKWAWPIPAPVKVVLTVKAGAGLAAAQVFAK